MAGLSKAGIAVACALLACAGRSGAAVAAEPCPNAALRTGPSAELPDCRAYEMVSPLDKNGGDIRAQPASSGGGLYTAYKQSSLDGERITYSSSTAFGDAVAGPYASQYLSSRGAGGWLTHGISPPRDTAVFEGKGTLPATNWDVENLFEGFTLDLCNAWLRDTNLVPLTPDGLHEYVNLYRRSNCGVEEFEALTNQGPAPATEYLNAAGEFGDEVLATGPGLRFQGASHDLRHQVFISGASLLPEEIGAELRCSTPVVAETIAYQWLRNGVPIEGATTPSYVIVPADAGAAIQCQVFAFNFNAGSTQAATKARVVAPSPATPVPVAPGLIRPPTTSSGLTVKGAGGQTLTCDPNEEGWRGAPTFTYQWYRNGVAILGATASTYVVTKEDVATPAVFQCAVIGTNAGGTVVKVSRYRPTNPAPSPPAPCNGTPSGPVFCNPSVSMNKTRLYDLHDGQLELVGILPDGKPTPENSVAGTLGSPEVGRQSTLEHVVSEDGSRIFWTSKPESPTSRGSAGPGQIYVRIDGDRTLEVSGAVDPKAAARYWTAAVDGSAVLFTIDQDLYEFDVDAAIAGDPEPERLIASQVPGVLGAADDLSRIYFVSRDVLDEGAVAGEWNLYVKEGVSATLVAVLSDDDAEIHTVGISPIRADPIGRASRVSADGRRIAFQSIAKLTEYENADSNGKRYSEVFHYDAVTGKLTCVSCNPNGPPSGSPILTPYNAFDKPLADSEVFDERFGEAATLPTCEREQHCSRALTEDGRRVFFHSHEALVARDTNGVKDVYQWEAQGSGTCEQVGGCVALISTGTGAQSSEFVDASADGRDVFFSTTSRIDPRDERSIDIYDARVDGGFPIPPPPPECQGDACHGIPSSPSRETSTGAIFAGPGNPPVRRDCAGLARRAAKLARQARRTGSARGERRAKQARKRLKRCRRANRGGSR